MTDVIVNPSGCRQVLSFTFFLSVPAQLLEYTVTIILEKKKRIS